MVFEKSGFVLACTCMVGMQIRVQDDLELIKFDIRLQFCF